MSNYCDHHGWTNKDNEPCPYCIIDQLSEEVETWEETTSKYEDREFAACLKVIADLRVALTTIWNEFGPPTGTVNAYPWIAKE